MQIFQGMNIALRALRENKLRTFLTLLGNIVGTMSVIAVVSLIGGIDAYVKEKVAGEGSNVFSIERFNFFEAITDIVPTILPRSVRNVRSLFSRSALRAIFIP